MNEKLLKLQELLKIANDGLTRAEFIDSFKAALKQIALVEQKLIGKIDAKLQVADTEISASADALKELKQEFQLAVQETKDSNETTFANVKKRTIEAIDTLFMKMRLNDKFNELAGQHEQMSVAMDKKMKIEMSSMKSEHEAMMQKMDSAMPDTEKMMTEMMAKMPPETPETIRDSLETLKKDERLDISAIKGLDTLEKGISDRAIGILDQRTSFLINKTVKHDTTLSGSGTDADPLAVVGGGSGGQITVSATAPSSPVLNQLWFDIA